MYFIIVPNQAGGYAKPPFQVRDTAPGTGGVGTVNLPPPTVVALSFVVQTADVSDAGVTAAIVAFRAANPDNAVAAMVTTP